MVRDRRLQRAGRWVWVVLCLAGSLPALGLDVAVFGPGPEGSRSAIAGARVSVWHRTDENGYRLLARARTGERGRAHLSVTPGAEAVLVVTAPGFVRTERPVEADGDMTLLLDAGRRVTMKVLDARGKPVPAYRWSVVPGRVLSGARLAGLLAGGALRGPGILSPEPRSREAEYLLEGLTVREARGPEPLVISGLAEEEYWLLVSAPRSGFALQRIPARGARTIDVRIDRDGCYELEVVDADTEAPIEEALGAPAAAFLQGPFAAVWPAWPTGPDGVLLDCPDRFFGHGTAAVVSAPEYAPARVPSRRERSRVLLGSGAAILGTALDENGQPAAGRRVVATSAGFRFEAEVAGDGTFRLATVPAGLASLRLVDSSNGELLGGRSVQLDEGETYRVTLGPGHVQTLTILDGERPLPGWLVLIGVIHDDGLELLGRGRSDAAGEVRLRIGEWDTDRPPVVALLRDGRAITAPLPDRGLLARLVDAVTGAPQESGLILALDGRFLDGRVIDAESGSGVEGMLISARRATGCHSVALPVGAALEEPPPGGMLTLCQGWSGTTASDEHGRFQLFLPTKALSVEVAESPLTLEKRYASSSIPASDLPSEEEALTIRVRPLARLSLAVLGEDGAPPAACYTRWMPASEGLPYFVGRADRPCAVDLEPAVGTPIYVLASAEGYAAAVEGPLTLSAGETRDLQIRLARPGRLRVAGVTLPVSRETPYVPPGSLLDAAGRDFTYLSEPVIEPDRTGFRLDRVPPGDWLLVLAGQRRRIHVKPGRETVIDLSR